MNRRFIRGLTALLGLVCYVAFMVFVIWIISEHTVIVGDKIGVIRVLSRIYGFFLILTFIKDSRNYSYVLPWIMIILLAPFLGTILYIVVRT